MPCVSDTSGVEVALIDSITCKTTLGFVSHYVICLLQSVGFLLRSTGKEVDSLFVCCQITWHLWRVCLGGHSPHFLSFGRHIWPTYVLYYGIKWSKRQFGTCTQSHPVDMASVTWCLCLSVCLSCSHSLYMYLSVSFSLSAICLHLEPSLVFSDLGFLKRTKSVGLQNMILCTQWPCCAVSI